MKCNAMLFNLESSPSKKTPGQINRFMTFVDMDTGESFRCYVNDSIAGQYRRLQQCEITLSISLGEFNGNPQLDTRILEMKQLDASLSPASQAEFAVSNQEPASTQETTKEEPSKPAYFGSRKAG
jgi:hypothetical protein